MLSLKTPVEDAIVSVTNKLKLYEKECAGLRTDLENKDMLIEALQRRVSYQENRIEELERGYREGPDVTYEFIG